MLAKPCAQTPSKHGNAVLSRIAKGLPPDKRRELGSLCVEEGFFQKKARHQPRVPHDLDRILAGDGGHGAGVPEDLDRILGGNGGHGVGVPDDPDDPDQMAPAFVDWQQAPALDDPHLLAFHAGLEEEFGDDFDVDVLGHGFALDDSAARRRAGPLTGEEGTYAESPVAN